MKKNMTIISSLFIVIIAVALGVWQAFDVIPSIDGQVAEEDADWSFKVGTSQAIKLDGSKLGDVLVDGERIVITKVDEHGKSKTFNGCQSIPEIEVTKSINPNDETIDQIELYLDPVTCEVSLIDIHDTEKTDDLNSYEVLRTDHYPFDLTMRQEIPIAGNKNIMFFNAMELYPEDNVIEYQTTYEVMRAKVEAEVVAADGAGFALTQVEIELDYDTQDFEVFTHRYDCDADSPAGWVGVSWVEDACQPTGYELSDDRSQITAATEGEFHAVVGSAHSENGDSEHTSRAKIVGDSDGYVGSCRWTPSDIEDYEVVFFHVFPAGVRLECLVNGG